jgi:hypothetical protein
MTSEIQKGISAILNGDKKKSGILGRTIEQGISKIAVPKVNDIDVARKSKKSKPKTKKGKKKDCGCDV